MRWAQIITIINISLLSFFKASFLYFHDGSAPHSMRVVGKEVTCQSLFFFSNACKWWILYAYVQPICFSARHYTLIVSVRILEANVWREHLIIISGNCIAHMWSTEIDMKLAHKKQSGGEYIGREKLLHEVALIYEWCLDKHTMLVIFYFIFSFGFFPDQDATIDWRIFRD